MVSVCLSSDALLQHLPSYLGFSYLGRGLAFLSTQCKEIEENNRLGKTRELFKKIRDTKRTLHARMSMVKDRNGRDVIEAEDIRKRWQEYTELYRKRPS